MMYMLTRSVTTQRWVLTLSLLSWMAAATAQNVPPAVPSAPAVEARASGSAVPPEPRQIEFDYRIGQQDLLDIMVYGQADLTRTVRVNSRGLITLPLIGQVTAQGLTAQQLEQNIAGRLAENFLQDPQVTVFIKEFTTLRFTVEGAVNKPGVYPLIGQMTLLRALAIAGGQGSLSDLGEVMLFRFSPEGSRQTTMFDVDKIRNGETADPPIRNDDLVVVKRSKARTALKDSLLGDVLQSLKPFSFLR